MAKGMMLQAAAPKVRGKATKHAEVRQAANGGFIVRLCHNAPGEYHEPEEHALGKEEGGKVLELIGMHIGIPGAINEGGEEYHEKGKTTKREKE